MTNDPHSTSVRAVAILLPALVDHPGNVAWQRGVELARATGADVHVLHPVHGGDADRRDHDRGLIAAERALQQWVLGRTIGKPVAQRVTLHVAWQSDTMRAVDELVAHRGVDTVVVAVTRDTEALVKMLTDRLPCSVHLAAERPRVAAASEGRVDEVDGAREMSLRSVELAVPGPLPDPPSVTAVVG